MHIFPGITAIPREDAPVGVCSGGLTVRRHAIHRNRPALLPSFLPSRSVPLAFPLFPFHALSTSSRITLVERERERFCSIRYPPFLPAQNTISGGGGRLLSGKNKVIERERGATRGISSRFPRGSCLIAGWKAADVENDRHRIGEGRKTLGTLTTTSADGF